METIFSMWLMYAMLVFSLVVACLPGSSQQTPPTPHEVSKTSIVAPAITASPLSTTRTPAIVVPVHKPATTNAETLAAIRHACHKADIGDPHVPPSDWGIFGQSLRAFLRSRGMSHKQIREFEAHLATTKTAHFCTECGALHVKMRGAI